MFHEIRHGKCMKTQINGYAFSVIKKENQSVNSVNSWI